MIAFVRGVERRGAVFAELQWGDPVVGEQVYAAALRHFTDLAPWQPFATWPRLFWRGLMAPRPSRRDAAVPRWTEAYSVLGALGAGPRAALLLRLVARLTDADAAAVLGVAPPIYRMALSRALPRGADAGPDPQAWSRLDQALQQHIGVMPAERLAYLAVLRQTVIEGGRPDRISTLAQTSVQTAPRIASQRLQGLLWVGLVLCALALLASFVFPTAWTNGSRESTIRVQPLGPAPVPARRYDTAWAFLTEPDFEWLVVDPPTAPADDPAFYAWLAAELMSAPDNPTARLREHATQRKQQPSDRASDEPPETSDAPL